MPLRLDYENVSGSENFEYVKVVNVIKKWILTLPDRRELIAILNDRVKSEIEGDDALPPNILFDKYGTHFITELIVGAKATYNAAINKRLYQSEMDLGTTAEMSYKKIVNKIQIDEKSNLGIAIKEFQSNSQTCLHAVGGKPEYASFITTESNYEKWINSIDSYPQFCDFTQDGLQPIWTLCSKEERRNELAKAFENYAKSKEKHFPQMYVGELDIVSDPKNPQVAPPYGYYKINVDINEGHKHDYLYLCYKPCFDTETKPVTDIKVLIDDKVPIAPSGYKMIPRDLNKGEGGKFVYICYTKEADKGPGIRGIKIISGEEGKSAPYGYDVIRSDLKVSRGGNFVYICTSKYLNNEEVTL